jgi:hypothetical protein
MVRMSNVIFYADMDPALKTYVEKGAVGRLKLNILFIIGIFIPPVQWHAFYKVNKGGWGFIFMNLSSVFWASALSLPVAAHYFYPGTAMVCLVITHIIAFISINVSGNALIKGYAELLERREAELRDREVEEDEENELGDENIMADTGSLSRKSCPDEMCIGVIGQDGRCSVCGLEYNKNSIEGLEKSKSGSDENAAAESAQGETSGPSPEDELQQLISKHLGQKPSTGVLSQVDEIIVLVNWVDDLYENENIESFKYKNEDNKSAFRKEIDKYEARLREIAQDLYDEGGLAKMQEIYSEAYQKAGWRGRYLDGVWNGVGEWMG